MKHSNFKRIISASLAALALCPAIISISSTTSAYAAGAFISDTDYNAAINIDESQISVSYSTSRAFGTYINTKISNGVISSKQQANGFPTLQNVQVIINVQGTKIDQNAVNELKNTTLKLMCSVEGVDNTQTYKVSNVEKKSNTSYNLVFDNVTLLGSSLSFELSKITKVTGLKCGSALVQSNGGSYYYINVKTPNAENLYIRLRNASNVTIDNMKKWAKRICMYANSLSQMTGVKLGTLYMNFDDTGSAYGYSCNAKLNPYCKKLGFTGFGVAATNAEIQRLALNKNEITWTILHEVAHSYCVQASSSKFWYNFVPIHSSGYQDDEYFTNVRGLTAIQNCDNLKNTDIYIGNRSGKTGKYNTIANIIEISKNVDGTSEYIYYTFAKKLSNIANTYGWDKLETYFAAKTDYDYKSTENRNAAKAINSLLGTSYPVNDDNMDFARMTNNLRKLYKLTWGNGNFNANNFKEFVSQLFGTSFIREVYSFIDQH